MLHRSREAQRASPAVAPRSNNTNFEVVTKDQQKLLLAGSGAIIEENKSVIKAGLNFRFGGVAAPVVAKY